MCINTKGLINLQTMYIPGVNSCVDFEFICKLSFTCLDATSEEAMSLDKKPESLDVIFQQQICILLCQYSVNFRMAERIPPRRRLLLTQEFDEGCYKQ